MLSEISLYRGNLLEKVIFSKNAQKQKLDATLTRDIRKFWGRDQAQIKAKWVLFPYFKVT